MTNDVDIEEFKKKFNRIFNYCDTIGKGAFGTVILVEDANLEKLAIKVSKDFKIKLKLTKR